jgi:hypothetical protein
LSQLPQLLFEKSTSIFENDKKPLLHQKSDMPTGVPRRRTKNLAEREIARWNRQRTETQHELAEKYRLENAVRRAEILD